jgi:hypothetical protein
MSDACKNCQSINSEDVIFHAASSNIGLGVSLIKKYRCPKHQLKMLRQYRVALLWQIKEIEHEIKKSKANKKRKKYSSDSKERA